MPVAPEAPPRAPGHRGEARSGQPWTGRHRSTPRIPYRCGAAPAVGASQRGPEPRGWSEAAAGSPLPRQRLASGAGDLRRVPKIPSPPYRARSRKRLDSVNGLVETPVGRHIGRGLTQRWDTIEIEGSLEQGDVIVRKSADDPEGEGEFGRRRLAGPPPTAAGRRGARPPRRPGGMTGVAQ